MASTDIRNPFDAPIPGQSLTDTPGNASWEHPPQYTKLDETAEVVWDLLHEPNKLEQIILLLHSGVSVEALTKSVIFSGFVKGKWTPDLGLLLTEIVFNQILAIGMRAKLKNIRMLIGDHTNSTFREQLAEFNVSKKDDESKRIKSITKIKEDIKESSEKVGLMAGGQ